MPLVSAIRRRLAAESGFTVIELMVSVAIGIVVLLGITNLLDSGGRANARLTDKTETVQRTRLGMDRIARVLRTQACLNQATPPVIEGTADSVTFYSDTPSKTQVDAGLDDMSTTDGDPTEVFQPRKIKLTFSDAGNGSVTQETWTTQPGKPSGTYDSSSPPYYGKRVLLDYVGRNGSKPFLRYYSFTDTDAELPMPLNGTLSLNPAPANSVTKVVKIDVALEARPQSGNRDIKRRTAMSSTVISRNADLSGASDPERKVGPRCG